MRFFSWGWRGRCLLIGPCSNHHGDGGRGGEEGDDVPLEELQGLKDTRRRAELVGL